VRNTVKQVLWWVGVCMRVCVFAVGLSDASYDLHYSQLYGNCCPQVSSATASNEYSSALETERRYFMSRLNDIVMRLVFHQVHFYSIASATSRNSPKCFGL